MPAGINTANPERRSRTLPQIVEKDRPIAETANSDVAAQRWSRLGPRSARSNDRQPTATTGQAKSLPFSMEWKRDIMPAPRILPLGFIDRTTSDGAVILLTKPSRKTHADSANCKTAAVAAGPRLAEMQRREPTRQTPPRTASGRGNSTSTTAANEPCPASYPAPTA